VSSRRAAILAAYEEIVKYERGLCERLLVGMKTIPGATVYGITDPERFDQRCPTIAVRIQGFTPLELATRLGERGFFTWDGNYYALNVTEQLDLEKDGGFLRIGLFHYNTVEEVDGLLGVLREVASS
jgi:selenocysteine lyase/cysteine desulfurase